MKRHGSSDSLGVLMSICPDSTDEQTNLGNNPVYANPEYHHQQAMMDGYDDDQCLDQESCQVSVSEKKRRLRVDQVKALEKNFEVENKLEPEKKVKLAEELGLQPRQVAVWFQNRRARWKTKQLERDYGVLKASYDGLKLNFDKLHHENEALMKEIRELKTKINTEGYEKEGDLMSDSDEKSKPGTPIVPNPDKDSDPLISGHAPAGSDSDNSSAVLNDDNINSSSQRQREFVENDGDRRNISYSNDFQFQEPNQEILAGKEIPGDAGHLHHHQQLQFVKIEEQNFLGEESCSTFFSDDQPPSLHWYEWS